MTDTLLELETQARIAWLLAAPDALFSGTWAQTTTGQATGPDGTVIQVAFDYDEQGARRWRYYGVIPGDTEPVDLSREQAKAMLGEVAL
jgi:hypothetical protein